MSEIRPKFAPVISLGNWLTIGALFVAGAAGWFSMEARSEQNEIAITELQVDLKTGLRDLAQSSETFRNELEVRVRAMEISQARNDQAAAHILDLLQRIEARLERIERVSTDRSLP